MKIGSAILASTALALPALAWEPGTYPEAPARMQTKGFSVDTSDRNDVVSFWQAVYMASEGYEARMNWTGNFGSTAAGAEGTLSRAFLDDVERRINYFRAMAGVPADVSINTTAPVRIDSGDAHVPPAGTLKSVAAQRGAFLTSHVVATTNTLTHNPPSAPLPWTTIGWNGCSKGNLASGIYGPGAVTEYFREVLGNGTSGLNSTVGHRRWLLHPRATDFATGDVPASATHGRAAANCLYVAPLAEELRTDVPARFVAYPSAGYFPAPLNGNFWSLSYPSANFATATVTMTDAAGTPLTTTVKARGGTTGDPALVWEVPAIAAMSAVTDDVTFHVTVSGIAGSGVPASHSYSVTLINPDRITSDQSLTGTEAPAAGVPATYFFPTPAQAREVAIHVFQPLSNSTWVENAEVANAPFSMIIDGTAPTYPLIGPMTGMTAISGNAFRLTMPVYLYAPPDQWFELDRQILPDTHTNLTFRYKRGLMSVNTALEIQTSDDDGATWIRRDVQISTNGGGSWTTHARIAGQFPLSGGGGSLDINPILGRVPLSGSPSPLKVKFRLHVPASGFYSHDLYPTHPTGIFIDDIGVTSGEWLKIRTSNELPPTADRFTLSDATAGAPLLSGERWLLRMRIRMGERWMNHGPPKNLQITATPALGYDAWEAYEYPLLSGGFYGDHDGDGIPNGVEYAFDTDPLVQSTIPDLLEILTSGGGDGEISALGQNAFLRIRRPLRAVRHGVTYGLEWSDDLIDWRPEGVSVSTIGGSATATVPAGNGRRFLRWRIEKN